MTDLQKEEINLRTRRWENHGSISIKRVFDLAYMAEKNIWPDGTFSDDECAIWFMFRQLQG